MSPIDERLKTLGIVLPDVMPPVVDGYVPAFAPFICSGDQLHLSGRLGKEEGIGYFVGPQTRVGLIFGYGAADLSEMKQGLAALRKVLQG